MSDARTYLKLSRNAYNNMPVPDVWREAFGRMNEPAEEGQEPVEIEPTFRAYLDHLGHPGGALRCILDAEGVLTESDPDNCTWVYVPIPWDRANANAERIRAMKAAVNAAFAAEGVTWVDRWLTLPELQEETRVSGGEGL